MKIARLSLANVRAFKEAEFTFNPGFNLIIGINGAGKSTVLDAIRYCGSHLLSNLEKKMPLRAFGFGINDIHGSAPFAEAALYLHHNGNADAFVRLREWREQVAAEATENVERLRREILETERPRDRLRTQLRELQETISPAEPVFFHPSKHDLMARAISKGSMPLMIHYSTARSIMNEQAGRTQAIGDWRAAYVNALQSNALSIRQFAVWVRALSAMASELPASGHLLDRINSALELFLPGYSNLRPTAENTSRVEIDNNGTTLDVRQLSDGQRSVLVLVLDIAKRLAQANPQLNDPLTNAEAVILIDEIDLHLHPQWQRKIVGNLEKTFPNCQFIATSHSPQIIGEVQPDKITLLKRVDGHISLEPCGQSYGLDTNYVLEQVMETPSRSKPVKAAIDEVESALEIGDLDLAREKLSILRKIQHGDDPTTVGFEAEINNLEALTDEAD
ncbi:AAA family ATPase [Paracoccus rhizosphaerae]|uniref:AAA family ATPase n=1 Tax=Paracoccus rhizosphaerae TaxID=1133347 RepID=A0ABV6CHE4_9RHOB|nr:AAA family ATPase [Paracoccus rhizosphaerae]